MSQAIHSTEGIVLKVVPFKDYDQIISIFTPEAGVIKVMHKGSYAKRRKGKSPCMPLTAVEVLYREKKGEIFGCHELNCMRVFPALRKELSFLETACDLLQVILDSQFMGKSAPQLYALLCYYLRKIPLVGDPWVLAASFRLKLLKHDGLVGFPFICSECGVHLHAEAYIRDSEGWCVIHRPQKSQRWCSTELHTVYRLAESQSLQEIGLLDVSPVLQEKIVFFFKKSLHMEPFI